VKIKIWHKLLILVLAPLLVDVALMYGLQILRTEAAAAAEEASNESQVLYSMNVVFLALSDGIGQLAGFAVTHDHRSLNKSRTQLKLAQEKLQELHRLTDFDPIKSERSRPLLSLVAAALAELSQRQSQFENSDSSFLLDQIKQLKPFMNKASELEQKLLSAMQNELSVQMQATSEKLRLQGRIEQLIQISVVGNAFLATLLLIVFSRGVTSRIAVIVDNSRRFAERKRLHAPMSGSDELTELDLSFRKMVTEIENAEERRRSLMAMVAHDLRAPLMSTQVSLSLLEVGALGEIEEEGRKEITVCQHNTERVICLITELLDIEKSEAGKLELNLGLRRSADLISSSVESLAAFARLRNIEVVQPKIDLLVVCDGERIIQVMVNLLSNALKFSPPGTRVSIDVEEHTGNAGNAGNAGNVANTGKEEHAGGAGNAVFSVTDQGPGLSAESIAKLGEKFQVLGTETDARFKGSGLGIYICQWIVRSHGGSFGVDSSEGAGARFWFSLPTAKFEEE
jgi:signal transduction histidine kinase